MTNGKEKSIDLQILAVSRLQVMKLEPSKATFLIV